MTVKELIEELKKFPEEYDVYTEGDYPSDFFIVDEVQLKTIKICTESHIDNMLVDVDEQLVVVLA